MGTFGFPDICGFFDMLYGTAGVDLGGLTCLFFGDATGLVFPGNPPYTVTDFIGIYPKFIGPPTNVSSLTTVINTAIVTGFSDVTPFAVGELIVNTTLFAKDTVISSIDTVHNTITMSNNALASSSSTSLVIYTAPLLPLVAILSFVNLALASLSSCRYFEAWTTAMALFIAHYCTMYMRTESGYQSFTQSQAVISGLTKGINVSQAAGDVSKTAKLLDGYDEFGAWRETQYGELLITLARSISCGPIWVK